ncbi:MAG: hypothetical protein ACPGYP_00120, partial [Solirubrobacterales bacterium]
KESFTYGMMEKLAEDIESACATLEVKGGLHEADRKKLVKTNPAL